MLKVVLDTNVLIDGSGDDYNYGKRIIDEVIAGDIEAFANRATLAENRLLAKNKITDEGYLRRLEYYFEAVKIIEGGPKLQVVAEDVQDNKLIEAAVACGADYLITSDQHLLKLEKFKDTKIARPGEFWGIYQDATSDGWLRWIKDFIK